MISEFRLQVNEPISKFDYHSMATQFRHQGMGNNKIKLKRDGNELVFYVSSGFHALKFDCLNNYNFTYHVLSRKLIGEGEHSMPATLTANQFTHYLDVCTMSSKPFWISRL